MACGWTPSVVTHSWRKKIIDSFTESRATQVVSDYHKVKKSSMYGDGRAFILKVLVDFGGNYFTVKSLQILLPQDLIVILIKPVVIYL